MKSVHVNNHIRKNTVYNMIKTCSGIVFPLLTFPYLSRVLTPEYVGKCHFSSTFVSYFSLVASLGLPAYAIRECAAVRGDPDRFGSSFPLISVLRPFHICFCGPRFSCLKV